MSSPKNRTTRPRTTSTRSAVEEARNVPDAVRLGLVAAAAGRCAFRGCNHELFRHPVTASPGNYAQAAHIVAFREGGPRGGEPRPTDINAPENLMLLCGACHREIDAKPLEFTVADLRDHKQEHEERILAVTELGPECRTTVIQLRATIGGQPVDIPASDARAALHPRYPARWPGVLVDLTGLQRESSAFFELAREQVRRELRPALRAELERKRVQHYSVFALAPIPVLMCLGRELGNKVDVDLFQRHRDGTWRWREDGPVAEYDFTKVREGAAPDCVALQLSLSGQITEATMPAGILDTAAIYALTLRGQAPNVEFLQQRADLHRFRAAYRAALGAITAQHGAARELHLFPAVPAPIAIACGQEIMPKAHPALVIYDNVKGMFKRALTINTEEDL